MTLKYLHLGFIQNSSLGSLSIVYPTVDSGTDQRKHQNFASQAFVRGIHRWPVNFPHKEPVTPKIFPFDDVIMVNATEPNWEVNVGTGNCLVSTGHYLNQRWLKFHGAMASLSLRWICCGNTKLITSIPSFSPLWLIVPWNIWLRFKYVYFKHDLGIGIMSIQVNITLEWL